jgi:adenylate cyclase
MLIDRRRRGRQPPLGLTLGTPSAQSLVMDVAELEAAGLYDPKSPNAAERLELLEWLVSRGTTIEQMKRAANAGLLHSLAGDLVLRPGSRYTRADVAERAGVSVERVRELSLSAGLPPAAPDDPVYTDEDVRMFATFAGGSTLFGTAAVLRFIRTVGSSLARIAEAAVSLFLVNVEEPMRRQHATERALAEANLRAIETIDGVERMLLGLFRTHMEAAIARFRHARHGDSLLTAHMTVGFIDLVGFTSLSGRMSPAELGRLVEHFEETAHDVVTARGGRVVKLIGDEVMFVAVDAAAACDSALALCEHFVRDDAVTPRGALATGDLLIRGGDYYGAVVNLASRVAQLAVPNEILVTQELAAEARAPALRFAPAGKRMLKGFDEPVALLTVERGNR